ncbi:conjugal transfer protein TrbN [Janthinobacterium sp. BJB304]|uniref:conjugal transfer protein TrbN n=1 Tax=Janthinobacterium sp. BJB304 TaxID=1572871 RepID=UPI000C11CC45|nr:conjugal transfer protein TrbN [Janthinobacterium sp. BJB304]PHV39213.1 conjugal transfer protein TrbN [Janthinobacterium sp. BJB304]
MLDLPPLQQERIVCSITAAIKYQVPANILLAIAEKEGGRPGMIVANKNDTYDIGPMQFNSAYLLQLRQYGITPAHVAAKGCYPYYLAAWRLRQHLLHDTGNLWARAANYHSRTAQYNLPYRVDLIRKGNKWAMWLDYNLSFVPLAVPK